MTANVVNQVAYLRTTREFPEDLHQLTVEVNKSYLDIANVVNARTIGIFPTNRPAITGESWFINSNRKQQSLRQVYNISSIAPFNHGLDFTNISFFTVIRGIGFDGTNYFPIPYVIPFSVTGQIGIYVSPTQVVLSSGVGAPVLTSGIVILEWLSNI